MIYGLLKAFWEERGGLVTNLQTDREIHAHGYRDTVSIQVAFWHGCPRIENLEACIIRKGGVTIRPVNIRAQAEIGCMTSDIIHIDYVVLGNTFELDSNMLRDKLLNKLNTLGTSLIAKKDLYNYLTGDNTALDKYTGDPEK